MGVYVCGLFMWVGVDMDGCWCGECWCGGVDVGGC